jgi:hypothetical protein
MVKERNKEENFEVPGAAKYFPFEKKIVKCFVQCHTFTQKLQDQHSNDKYPVNTLHRSQFE